MSNKKKSKKQSSSTSGHHHGSSSSSVVAVASNQNIANVRNIFTQPVNLDSCFLCDDHKPKGLSKKSKRQGVIPHTLQDFWLEAPIKKKLQLLQMDCKFVLDQIRCSSPYTTKEGDKPAFLSKPSSCLCPACRKKKAIFNAVIAVFEDYVNELEGKPPSANSASQQVAASFQHSKLKTSTTTTTQQQQPLAISSDCATNNSTTTTAQPSTTEHQQQPVPPPTTTNNTQQQATTATLSENDHVLVSKQLSKISEKTQFLIEDEANNNTNSTSSTTNTNETSQTTIATTSDNTLPQTEVPLPFGRYLTVKNGKITVTDDYVRRDNCEHFLKVIQKCEEAFPNDLKLGPNEFPVPENIHTLINYCTANSEVNIKKILLKNAKKAFSNNNNNNHHHSLTSPQTQNQTNPTNSNVMTSQILNLFQQQQGGATATLTLGSNGTVLNNVNVQMVTDNTKQNSKTPPTNSQNSSSLSTSHLQVQVPPSVTITATSSTIQTHTTQKSSVVVHSSSQTSSTAALVVSGSIDMTSTGSGSSQNMKVVNGSIAMVHLGNVKDLIRGGESNTNATVVLNNLQHEEDDDEEEEEEEDDEEAIDEEDEEEEEEEDDEEEGDEEDLESETDDEETLDEYSQSDTDEEVTNDKGSANHSEMRLKNRSFEHDDQYYSKRRISRDKRHGQKEGDTQKEQDEKNEILASNMRESKLLFQIYLARLFSHNIRVAYNDLCASEMQKCLLEEFERESEMKATTSKNSNKNKKSSKKNKDKKKEEKPATPVKKPNTNQSKTPEKSANESTKVKPSEDVTSPNQSIGSSTNNDYDSDENYEQDYLNNEEQEEDDYYDDSLLDYDYDDDFENRGAVQDWNVVTKKPKQPKAVNGPLTGTTTPRGTTYNTYSNRGRGGLSVRGGRGGSHTMTTQSRPTSTSSNTTTATPGTPSKVTTPATVPTGNTPQKVTTTSTTTVNTPQKPSSYYSVSNGNQPSKNTPNTSNEKYQASHQFHSQHVKSTSTSSTTIISSNGNTSGTPLPVPVPTLQPLPQTQQPQQPQPLQTQQGGFILLPSAVNGANSKITKHSRQQSSSSVSSNNTSTSLESPMHPFVNQTPSGNSTVSSVVGELLNEDEYLMLSGLKRSTTPSTTGGASTSSPNSVGSGPNTLPNPQAYQNQHSLFGGSNTLFDSSFGNIAKNNVSPSNGGSPRANIYNPFDMGMQYGNPNMMPQYNPTPLGMGNGLYPGFNLFGPPSSTSSFPMTNTIQQAPQQQASNASWSLFQGYGSFSWNPIMGNNGNISNMNLGGLSNSNPPQSSTPFNGSNNSAMKNTVPSE